MKIKKKMTRREEKKKGKTEQEKYLMNSQTEGDGKIFIIKNGNEKDKEKENTVITRNSSTIRRKY